MGSALNTAKLSEVYLAAEGDVSCGGHLVGLRAVADYVIEQAAQICEQYAESLDNDYNRKNFDVKELQEDAKECAAQIRAIIETGAKDG